MSPIRQVLHNTLQYVTLAGVTHSFEFGTIYTCGLNPHTRSHLVDRCHGFCYDKAPISRCLFHRTALTPSILHFLVISTTTPPMAPPFKDL